MIREMGKLNTHSMKDNWEYWLSLKPTLDRMYLTSILEVQHLQLRLHDDDKGVV